MTDLGELGQRIAYLAFQWNWLTFVDLLLVTLTFYGLLVLIRRSHAALLLRGGLILALVLFVITSILPLPTFDWLMRTVLVAILIAAPIIFHPELRQALERVGRVSRLIRLVEDRATQQMIPALIRAVERMAANYIGALIVLEGHISLQDYIRTGVPLDALVSSEMLEAIFYPHNPLHDGAAILRSDRIAAAACVLPLTQRPLRRWGHLGTRHRAAVGLSEVSDAMVLIVSEERGEISVAYNGRLHRRLDLVQLREHLFAFYGDEVPQARWKRPLPTLWRLFVQRVQGALHEPREALTNAGMFSFAAVLALVSWMVVSSITNPPQRARVEGIPLQVTPPARNLHLEGNVPTSVSAIVQAPETVMRTLRNTSFQAVISLADLAPGLHHLPVAVIPADHRVRVLSVEPPAIDVQLVEVVTRTLPVVVQLTERATLPPAFEITGLPSTEPDRVTVEGPAPQVARIARAEVQVTLRDVRTTIQESRPVLLLDKRGQPVTGVDVYPQTVVVTVPIRRRLDTRDVAVHPVIVGTPARGYWLRSLDITPDTVTLQGAPALLEEIGGFVDTLPIDLEGAVGTVERKVPLDVPPEISVLDRQGAPLGTVTVRIRLEPIPGHMTVRRPVQAIGIPAHTTLRIAPAEVDVLLSGPQPVLDSIAEDPALVQVFINVAQTPIGEAQTLTPTVIAPEGIETRLAPPVVQVSLTPREQSP